MSIELSIRWQGLTERAIKELNDRNEANWFCFFAGLCAARISNDEPIKEQDIDSMEMYLKTLKIKQEAIDFLKV